MAVVEFLGIFGAVVLMLSFWTAVGSIVWRVFDKKRRPMAFKVMVCALGVFAVSVVGIGNLPEPPEQAARREAEEAEAAARAAAEAEWAALEEAACRDDINCWGERHWEYASVYCGPLIENLAAYQHEWTDGGYTPDRFRRATWADKKAGRLIYSGNAIRFQNAFGAWRRTSYACEYDPASETAVRVLAQ